MHPIPEPGQNSGSGFAKAGGDADQAADAGFFGEAFLVVVGRRLAGGGAEKGWKIFRHDGGEAFFVVKYYLMEV
jgi:hypothetical protein